MKPPWKITDLQDALTGTDHRRARVAGPGWREAIAALAGDLYVVGLVHEGETTEPQAVFWPMPPRVPIQPVYFTTGPDRHEFAGIMGDRAH